MIDFHSHILPGIDDGSKSTDMSLEMLRESARQGIETIIATPHFYADRNTPENFLREREKALKKVLEKKTEDMPQILTGAEVAFFRGMGSSEEIESFCIADTRLLLVEMPFRNWIKSDVRNIEGLLERGIIPVIAHVERFMSFQKDMASFDAVLNMPVLVQVNAEALLDWRLRGKVVKLFKTGYANLLGSDCHNTSTRPQNFSKGWEVLRKKLGQDFVTELDRKAKELFEPEDNLI